ncbi:hypothetical protein [Streptomyces sp. 1222.5]|uniref:hypothetical protein n=1 Tax=Streptomyces sp. 1222.5 TaxID=1881026 RepID=UPI003D746117
MGGPLKKYEVTTAHGVKTTMKLNEDDARRMGLLDSGSGEEEQAPQEPETKARASRNKSRTAADKGDG